MYKVVFSKKSLLETDEADDGIINNNMALEKICYRRKGCDKRYKS